MRDSGVDGAHVGAGLELFSESQGPQPREGVTAQTHTAPHIRRRPAPDGGALQLGSDVRGQFPDRLQTLTNPQIGSLLADYDTTPDSTAGSAAIEWSVLAQRLPSSPISSGLTRRTPRYSMRRSSRRSWPRSPLAAFRSGCELDPAIASSERLGGS
jgi:hypothetical protein